MLELGPDHLFTQQFTGSFAADFYQQGVLGEGAVKQEQ
jgi:hypothetical protein